MQPSPDKPPRAPGNAALYVLGFFVGLLVGGTVLTFLSFLAIGVAIGNFASDSPHRTVWFLSLGALPALAIAWFGVVRTRHALTFIAGSLIGLAAGLLGGTVLCGTLFGSNG